MWRKPRESAPSLRIFTAASMISAERRVGSTTRGIGESPESFVRAAESMRLHERERCGGCAPSPRRCSSPDLRLPSARAVCARPARTGRRSRGVPPGRGVSTAHRLLARVKGHVAQLTDSRRFCSTANALQKTTGQMQSPTENLQPTKVLRSPWEMAGLPCTCHLSVETVMFAWNLQTLATSRRPCR